MKDQNLTVTDTTSGMVINALALRKGRKIETTNTKHANPVNALNTILLNQTTNTRMRLCKA
ncbi:MAG: hypothetical protein ACQXXH_02000 [Candidatus Bathyarchaeia archaeon]|nr:hypothetical protein [Candidatus Bathyarchaeota archaeon A05DMB-4]MDH7594518.1 hypothetical protein [Candidatus Bathyarchaeota archaeon]